MFPPRVNSCTKALDADFLCAKWRSRGTAVRLGGLGDDCGRGDGDFDSVDRHVRPGVCRLERGLGLGVRSRLVMAVGLSTSVMGSDLRETKLARSDASERGTVEKRESFSVLASMLLKSDPATEARGRRDLRFRCLGERSESRAAMEAAVEGRLSASSDVMVAKGNKYCYGDDVHERSDIWQASLLGVPNFQLASTNPLLFAQWKMGFGLSDDP